jgi:hypothetical protein
MLKNMLKNIKTFFKGNYIILLLILISAFIAYYIYDNYQKKLEQFYQESSPTPTPDVYSSYLADPNVGKILIMNPIKNNKMNADMNGKETERKRSLCDPNNPNMCIYNFETIY